MKKNFKYFTLFAFMFIAVIFIVAMLIMNGVSFKDFENFEDRTIVSSSVSLNVVEEPEIYMSSGLISLNIVGNDLEKGLEE